MTKNSQNSISQTKSSRAIIDFNENVEQQENDDSVTGSLNDDFKYHNKNTAYTSNKNNESNIDLKKASIELVCNMMRNAPNFDCVLKGDTILNALKRAHMQLIEFDNFCKNREPAVPIHESVQPNFIYCLEDGKPVTILRKHLRNKFNMTPKQYRAKWNLSPDYPMVPAAYSKARSNLAKETGLGLSNKKKRV